MGLSETESFLTWPAKSAEEIADTVADPAEVESELRFLAAVLSKE